MIVSGLGSKPLPIKGMSNMERLTMTILICDDDAAIREAVSIYLRSEGYSVISAKDGKEALKYLSEATVHLILLDWMMPVMDGMSTLVKIREVSNVPVIMLTAKSEDIDTITGLSLGADDYITKPFKPMELVARVKSQLRRYMRLGNFTEAPDSFRSGGLMMDDGAKLVTVDGEGIHLTRLEYAILKLLLSSPGKVFSMDQIYEAVWEEPSFRSENTIAVHIRRIREKIEINPKEPKYLKVVWGIGYKIEKLE